MHLMHAPCTMHHAIAWYMSCNAMQCNAPNLPNSMQCQYILIPYSHSVAHTMTSHYELSALAIAMSQFVYRALFIL